jgi:hypothetical protein
MQKSRKRASSYDDESEFEDEDSEDEEEEWAAAAAVRDVVRPRRQAAQKANANIKVRDSSSRRRGDDKGSSRGSL